MAGFKVLLIIIASVMLIGCTQANNTDIISDTGTSLSDLENEVTESNILFPDNIEQITEIGDAAVSFEEVSDRITHTKAYPEGRSLVHKDTVRALERTFYVISAVYDNGDTVSAERTFWADVQTGDIYLYYDPVTMPNEQYSEYVGEISEDDGRSRLIPIDHDPDEWTKENIGTFLGTLDDVPERYYNFADIDSDGSDEMLVADNYLWAVKPLSDTEFDKQLVSIAPLGGYASVAYGRPSTDAEIYRSDDHGSWYTPNLDIYLLNGKFYISGVHISASAPYHIGWISEVNPASMAGLCPITGA